MDPLEPSPWISEPGVTHGTCICVRLHIAGSCAADERARAQMSLPALDKPALVGGRPKKSVTKLRHDWLEGAGKRSILNTIFGRGPGI